MEHPGASCLDRCEGAVLRSRSLCLRSLVCGARSLNSGSAESRAAMVLPVKGTFILFSIVDVTTDISPTP